jgi:hypothetical protein
VCDTNQAPHFLKVNNQHHDFFSPAHRADFFYNTFSPTDIGRRCPLPLYG